MFAGVASLVQLTQEDQTWCSTVIYKGGGTRQHIRDSLTWATFCSALPSHKRGAIWSWRVLNVVRVWLESNGALSTIQQKCPTNTQKQPVKLLLHLPQSIHFFFRSWIQRTVNHSHFPRTTCVLLPLQRFGRGCRQFILTKQVTGRIWWHGIEINAYRELVLLIRAQVASACGTICSSSFNNMLRCSVTLQKHGW